VATEALRWGEVHAPILVVAMLLGLPSAGGFDLAYKTIQAAAQLLGGIGVVMLPAFVRGEEPPSDVIARSLRLPTALGAGLALAAGVGLGPVLELLTGTELGLGAAPAAFVPVLLLAPWMGVSWTALVVLGGERWLIPSQVSVSVVTVAASFLAVGGVWWAAVAVSTAHLMGSVVRWRGLRALGHLPPRGWMSAGDWRRDLAWLGDAARRRA
jgi:O-antigen/teichoic acid export membrane protein